MAPGHAGTSAFTRAGPPTLSSKSEARPPVSRDTPYVAPTTNPSVTQSGYRSLQDHDDASGLPQLHHQKCSFAPSPQHTPCLHDHHRHRPRNLSIRACRRQPATLIHPSTHPSRYNSRLAAGPHPAVSRSPRTNLPDEPEDLAEHAKHPVFALDRPTTQCQAADSPFRPITERHHTYLAVGEVDATSNSRAIRWEIDFGPTRGSTPADPHTLFHSRSGQPFLQRAQCPHRTSQKRLEGTSETFHHTAPAPTSPQTVFP